MNQTKRKEILHEERGMTLIEVLAVLVIGSMFMLLAMTMLGTSIKMNQVSINETRLQQEANTIITQLQENHRRSECYTLDAAYGQVRIGGCEAGSETMTIGSDLFVHNLTASKSVIHPGEHDIDVELVVRNPENNRSFETRTTLTHLGVLR